MYLHTLVCVICNLREIEINKIPMAFSNLPSVMVSTLDKELQATESSESGRKSLLQDGPRNIQS